jgi:hypothetical protein
MDRTETHCLDVSFPVETTLTSHRVNVLQRVDHPIPPKRWAQRILAAFGLLASNRNESERST